MLIARSVRGMNDLFEPELSLVRKLEHNIKEIFSLYGFNEIRTPILEELTLFKRSVGETSDIVEKEMFVIKDNDNEYCLRPEGTASVVRALIERGGIDDSFNEKFFYLGPMFRKERPQKGRLRQFHQYGAETFGIKSPSADLEMLVMINHFLVSLGLTKFDLQLNSLGTKEEREAYKITLSEFITKQKTNLCQDCQKRMEKNILRVLDCKNEHCAAIVKKSPSTLDSLGKESKEHFDFITNGLKEQNISFTLNQHLVRGLDYYNRTVFEFIYSDGLGSQNAIAAGGRYDGLFLTLGNKIDVPAIGFAGGFERLILALGTQEKASNNLDLVIVYADEQGKNNALPLCFELRKLGIKADTSLENKSLKAQMRRADKLNSSFVMVLGETEIATKKVTLKNFGKDQKIEMELSPIAIANNIKNQNRL